jgi:hypothetical protein
MRTTVNEFKVPRLLVRIAKEDRTAMSEKNIRTNDGSMKTLYLNMAKKAAADQEDENKLAVRYGTVIGMSEGVSGYKRGDIAILDYKVDVDEEYLVSIENGDKIVSVPCMTTFCKDEIIATTYDKRFIERNVIVQKPGEVEHFSMVFGIVRQNQFLPNPHYVFCAPRVERPQSLIVFSGSAPEKTHIQRTVIYAHKQTGLKSGDEILAIAESNMPLNITGRYFEIISSNEILAVVENEHVAE